MEKLIFATNNQHKLIEVKKLLEGLFEVVGMEEAGISEDIPENEPTLEGNARVKAQFIHERLGMNVFADDTGLEIQSLNGEPGVFSARYAGPAKSAVDNMNLVLKKMKGVKNRTAQFRTAICLILHNNEYNFEGFVKGEMLTAPEGVAGFGYDPIFKPNGYEISFAQMDMATKNKISHRGRAVQKLIDFLKSQTK